MALNDLLLQAIKDLYSISNDRFASPLRTPLLSCISNNDTPKNWALKNSYFYSFNSVQISWFGKLTKKAYEEKQYETDKQKTYKP